jgi:hypothetical protein
MMPSERRTRLKRRPIEVEVDFLVPAADSSASRLEAELILLSKDIEVEVDGAKYVAITPLSARHEAWTIMKVGQWDQNGSRLNGRKVAISGVPDEFRRRFGVLGLLQGATLAPLDTLILKVSEHDYEHTSVVEDYHEFRDFQRDGIVFRTGKKFTTSDGVLLEVNLCESVRQGTLGEETEIIIVTDSGHDITANGFSSPISVESQSESNSDLDISQFLSLPSSEDYGEEDGHAIERTTLLPPEEDSGSRGIPLRVRILKQPIDKFSLEPRPAESEDIEFRVYGHMRDIARTGIFSGDWVVSL